MLSRLRRVNFAPDAMFDLLVVPAGCDYTVVSGHRDGRAARVVQGVPGGLYIDGIFGSTIGPRIAIADGGRAIRRTSSRGTLFERPIYNDVRIADRRTSAPRRHVTRE
jgi:hypothetical protein